MSDKKTRVRWHEDERDLLAERMVELLRKTPTLPNKELFVQAQDVLDESRRRLPLSGALSQEKTLFAEARKRASVQQLKPVKVEPGEALGMPVVTEREPTLVHIPVPTTQGLSEYPLKELLAEVIGRILESGWQRSEPLVAPPVAPEHSSVGPLPSALLKAPQVQALLRERPPKVGVCGMLVDQFRHVKGRVNNKKVELVFIDKDTSPTRESWPKSLDYAVVTRHVRHAHFHQAMDALGRGRVSYVPTGIDSVIEAIEAWIPGVRH